MTRSPLSLERLLNTPQLDRIVPHLPPGVLHRVIQHYGLEDCTELVALASPEQVARLLDEDVWHSSAGDAAVFDVERFGVWLAVLIQSGAAAAADKLAGLDTNLVIAGLAGHVAVFDRAAVSSYISLEGDLVEGRESDGSRALELGGYVIEAKSTTAWDAIVELFTFLEDERPVAFHRLLRGCVHVSSGDREADGFHDLLQDREQALFDVREDRDARRDALGYVTAATARAFLLEALTVHLDATARPVSLSARGYFRNLAPVVAPATVTCSHTDTPPSIVNPEFDPEAGVAAVVDLLTDGGVLRSEPRGLLTAGATDTSRFLVQSYVIEHELAADELAYLANVLIEASNVHGRPWSPQEASDAAAATCNLGLEHWPSRWQPHDLILAFQIGWRVLREEVCLFAARRLNETLAGLHFHDREIQVQIAALRGQLSRAVADGAPWRVRHALDVLLLVDTASWAAMRGLIGECPVMNAAIRPSSRHAIRADEFEFIATRDDVALARRFVEELPTFLTR